LATEGFDHFLSAFDVCGRESGFAMPPMLMYLVVIYMMFKAFIATLMNDWMTCGGLFLSDLSRQRKYEATPELDRDKNM